MAGSIPPESSPEVMRLKQPQHQWEPPSMQLQSPATKAGSVVGSAHATLETVGNVLGTVVRTLQQVRQEQAHMNQFQASWTTYLRDPTEENLSTLLADLQEMKSTSPSLYKNTLSMLEPLEGQVKAALAGRTSIGELNAAIGTERESSSTWTRGISEGSILQSASLEGVADGARAAMPTLAGSAQTILNVLNILTIR